MSTHPESSTGDGSTAEEPQPDVCNVVRAVEEIGSKWKLVILDDLHGGEQRFNGLERSTGTSYYGLTEKGEALCPVFGALDGWAGAWL